MYDSNRSRSSIFRAVRVAALFCYTTILQGEPTGKPQTIESAPEREAREQTYNRDQLVEAVVVAKGLYGEQPDTAAKELEPVGKTRDLFGKYRLGVEPDFKFLAEAVDFLWLETHPPELVGLAPEEKTKRLGELSATQTQRETEFVQKGHAALQERLQAPESVKQPLRYEPLIARQPLPQVLGEG